MTADDLIDTMIGELIRRHGGTKRRWRTVLGKVRVYGADTHPHCNWSLTPGGSTAEIAAIQAVEDSLRERFPLLRP